MGTPSSGPRKAPGTASTTNSRARSPASASKRKAAKPQMAMSATQLPMALTAWPASNGRNPGTRRTRTIRR